MQLRQWDCWITLSTVLCLPDCEDCGVPVKTGIYGDLTITSLCLNTTRLQKLWNE